MKSPSSKVFEHFAAMPVNPMVYFKKTKNQLNLPKLQPIVCKAKDGHNKDEAHKELTVSKVFAQKVL